MIDVFVLACMTRPVDECSSADRTAFDILFAGHLAGSVQVTVFR